jgi:hypothetical protein
LQQAAALPHQVDVRYFFFRDGGLAVLRGPILGCLTGILPAEVKEVDWHEVAHWLGHDEEEVKELSASFARKRSTRRGLTEAPFEKPTPSFFHL